MPSRRRVLHPQETYRFSMTRTLSDYPLLIGEILRRDDIRAVRRVKHRSFLFDLGRVLGMRVATRRRGSKEQSVNRAILAPK